MWFFCNKLVFFERKFPNVKEPLERIWLVNWLKGRPVNPKNEDEIIAIIDWLIEFQKKTKLYSKIIKVGRTHTQDATPLTLGQEFSGYLTQLKNNKKRIILASKELLYIAQGGTARTIAWNTIFEFAASTAPTITATANKTDILTFRYNGSIWQEIGRVQNMAQT